MLSISGGIILDSNEQQISSAGLVFSSNKKTWKF